MDTRTKGEEIGGTNVKNGAEDSGEREYGGRKRQRRQGIDGVSGGG